MGEFILRGGPFQIGRSGANGAVDESRTESRSIPQSGSHEQIPKNPNIIEMIRNGIKRASPALVDTPCAR